MTPALRRSVHVAVLAVAATGLPLVWTRYAAPTPEELDPPPIDATALHLHVLAAPLLVFVLGAVWTSHVLPHLRARHRRASGISLLVLGLAMVASGYGLQVVTEEVVRSALGWTHTAASVAWFLVLVVHCTGRVIVTPLATDRAAQQSPVDRSSVPARAGPPP